MSGILDARPKVGYYYTDKNTLGMLMEEVSSITVKDILSLPVAVAAEQNAYEATITMFLEDVGTLFIVGEHSLLQGVVSRKDLLKAAINGGTDFKNLPVVMVMTPLSRLVVVEEDVPVAVAARKLIDNEIDCLPVVKYLDENKKEMEVVGRITKTNFTRLLVELAEGKGGNYHNE